MQVVAMEVEATEVEEQPEAGVGDVDVKVEAAERE